VTFQRNILPLSSSLVNRARYQCEIGGKQINWVAGNFMFNRKEEENGLVQFPWLIYGVE
jgi:hypothetical protein